MLRVVDPEDAYELHINLIRHGRAVCRPAAALRRVRRCGACAPTGAACEPSPESGIESQLARAAKGFKRRGTADGGWECACPCLPTEGLARTDTRPRGGQLNTSSPSRRSPARDWRRIARSAHDRGRRDARTTQPTQAPRCRRSSVMTPQPLPRRGPRPRRSSAPELPSSWIARRARSSTRSTRTSSRSGPRASRRRSSAAKPDLVGLQEAALWRTAPCDVADHPAAPRTTDRACTTSSTAPARTSSNGAPTTGSSSRSPSSTSRSRRTPTATTPPAPVGCDINGRLTMRDAILARQARREDAEPKRRPFQHPAPASEPGGVPVDVTRGWTSVDARVGGSRRFRFVNTHLEAFDNQPSQPHQPGHGRRQRQDPQGPGPGARRPRRPGAPRNAAGDPASAT